MRSHFTPTKLLDLKKCFESEEKAEKKEPTSSSSTERNSNDCDSSNFGASVDSAGNAHNRDSGASVVICSPRRSSPKVDSAKTSVASFSCICASSFSTVYPPRWTYASTHALPNLLFCILDCISDYLLWMTYCAHLNCRSGPIRPCRSSGSCAGPRRKHRVADLEWLEMETCEIWSRFVFLLLWHYQSPAGYR